MQTVIDYRLGGEPVYRVVDERFDPMRLPDEVQKSVVFLGLKERQGSIEKVAYSATAFFVKKKTDASGAGIIHLVTARHVADRLSGKAFCIRANDKHGMGREFTIDDLSGNFWKYHPEDDSVDAAVAIWDIPDEIDFLPIPDHMFLNPEKLLGKSIGVGDEVYVTGLFRLLSGTERNLPIVRTGNIAMLPSERVPIKGWHTPNINAYLIEARSIGGLSGSPVFAQRSIEVHAAEHSGRKPVAAGAVFLMGLIHGHWDVPSDKVDLDGQPEHINVGVAIVVPSHLILEVLDHPDLEARRVAAMDELLYVSGSPVLDGGSPVAIRRDRKREATIELTRSAGKSK